VNLTDKAKEKLSNAAGGVRGGRADDDHAGAEGPPDEGRFEPEDVRRGKKPKDNLPQPENPRSEG
jgi:hypothetical protein